MKANFNPTMNIQNSYNRFQKNPIKEEQKTEEPSSKISSQMVRKESILEKNVSNNSIIKNDFRSTRVDWDSLLSEEPKRNDSGFNWKDVIYGRVDQQALKKEMGEEQYNRYLKTLDSQSEGLISSRNFDKFF